MPPILHDKTTNGAAAAAQEQKPEPAQPPAKTLRRRSEFAGLLAQSGLRASLYLERKNSIDGNVSKSNMSEGAIAAIDDLTLQLKFWGKSSLDEEAFNLLLDDIGYSRERFGLFDDLTREGKIRNYGVSVETVKEALKAIEFEGVSTVQIIFNMFRQRPSELFFKEAKKKKEKVVFWCD